MSTPAQSTTAQTTTEEEKTDCYSRDEVTRYFFGGLLFLLIIGLIIYVVMYSSKTGSANITDPTGLVRKPTLLTKPVGSATSSEVAVNKYLLSNTPNM